MPSLTWGVVVTLPAVVKLLGLVVKMPVLAALSVGTRALPSLTRGVVVAPVVVKLQLVVKILVRAALSVVGRALVEQVRGSDVEQVRGSDVQRLFGVADFALPADDSSCPVSM